MLSKGVSRLFFYYKEVSSGFQEGVKVVLRKFQGCFQSASNVFREVSRKFSRSFKELSFCMKLIAATRAESRTRVCFSAFFSLKICQILDLSHFFLNWTNIEEFLIFGTLGRDFCWKLGAWHIEFVVVGEWFW